MVAWGRVGAAGVRFWTWLCLVSILAAPSVHALDPTRTIAQYSHDRWDHQTGLPGTAVQGIFQLSDGYLWLYSGGKILRFDGVRFIPVAPSVERGGTSEPIRSVNAGRGDQLVLRCVTRTYHMKSGQFTDALPPLHLPDGNDRVLLEARDGTLWIGADNHVFRVRDGRIEPVLTSTSWTWKIWEDRSGVIWIGTNSGLYRYKDGRILEYPTLSRPSFAKIHLPLEPGKPDGVILPRAPTGMLEDRNGTLWIATQAGLWKMKSGKLVQDAETAPLRQCAVMDLLEDRDGNLWAGTDGQGLFRMTRGRWSRYGSETGLSDDSIHCLQEDREGSLWIGTRTGLDRLRNSSAYTITRLDGLSNDNVSTVMEGRDGSIYAFTIGGGITQLKGDQIRAYTTRDGLASDFAGCLYESRDGAVWAGTDRGLSRYRNGRWKTYAGKEFNNRFISVINEDDRSLILGCSDLCFYRFIDGHLRPYDFHLVPGEGFRSIRYAYQIHRDEEGTLWFAMSAGLYRVRKDGRPEMAERTAFREPAHSIHDDGRGFIWITGPDAPGFTRLDKRGGGLVRYTPEIGARVEEIGHIVSDGEGNLWMNVRGGIARFARSELDAYAEGRSHEIHMSMLSAIDGLRSEECGTTGNKPNACKGRDGRLYFASRKGLVVVQPDHMPRNIQPPPVQVEEVVVDGQPQLYKTGLVLGPGRENVEIHYTALSLLIPSRVRFKYQLVGYDLDWVDAGSRRTAYYTKLPPGSYRFRVIACNNDGVWNERGTQISLMVKPRFHQTFWFYLLMAAAAVGGVYVWFLWRVRRMRKRHVELQKMVQERTSELQNEVAERTKAEQALNTYKAHLESVVIERTAELSSANVKLEREIVERRTGEEALRQSEDRYRRFFEEDVAGAFIATPDGRLVACNPSFVRIIGTTLAHSPAGLDLLHLFQDQKIVDNLLARLRKGGKILGCEFEMERSDGKPLHVLANIVGNINEKGELTEIKGYVLDTTERRELEDQLRQSQKMEAVGQLAGGVAHDFNNILTVILACSELLLAEESSSPDQKELVGEIREAGGRAATLTRQLLAFSRRQVVKPKELDLNEVVAPMEKMLRRLIGEHIQLSLSLSSEPLRVKADPAQIEQILMNLAVNARDAMPQGGEVTIETVPVSLDQEYADRHLDLRPGDYVRLTVRDTGVGIRLEHQPHIFEPFFTTKGLGRGTGLGLSTVYGIVRQGNGHVTLDSEPGKGTVFHVYLPRIEGGLGNELTAAEASSGSVPGQETILVAEDDDVVRDLVRVILQRAGYRVLDAASGADALRLEEQENDRIHLLITDAVMPGMNGRELADRIRLKRTGIKILFMSGYTGDVLGGTGGILPGVELLDKPFTPAALMERVRQILDSTETT